MDWILQDLLNKYSECFPDEFMEQETCNLQVLGQETYTLSDIYGMCMVLMDKGVIKGYHIIPPFNGFDDSLRVFKQNNTIKIVIW